jgi:predicted PurR-regulated permease PerM
MDTASTRVSRIDLTLTVLSILLMLTLITAVLWVLRPFLLALVWAMTIVVATWPLMLAVQARVRRRWVAVAVMTAIIVAVFVGPLLLAIRALVDNADVIVGWLRSLHTATIPPPPEWLHKIPLVGSSIVSTWTTVASAGMDELTSRLAPYASQAAHWIAGAVGSLGVLLLHFLLTVIIAVVIFINGEAAREALIRFGRRLAGDRGAEVVVLAGQAIRAVALGVVVTALVQTVLAGIGLYVAGVPFASLLTGVVLLMCIAQIGPILVLGAATVWLFWSGQTGWGTAFLIWSLFVGMLDNFLRPILIRKGADLPLLLIFAGVIGGLVAFGIIGLFIGPVVLAVAYTLIRQWMAEAETGEPPAVTTAKSPRTSAH